MRYFEGKKIKKGTYLHPDTKSLGAFELKLEEKSGMGD